MDDLAASGCAVVEEAHALGDAAENGQARRDGREPQGRRREVAVHEGREDEPALVPVGARHEAPPDRAEGILWGDKASLDHHVDLIHEVGPVFRREIAGRSLRKGGPAVGWADVALRSSRKTTTLS